MLKPQWEGKEEGGGRDGEGGSKVREAGVSCLALGKEEVPGGYGNRESLGILRMKRRDVPQAFSYSRAAKRVRRVGEVCGSQLWGCSMP